ncbi:MAG: hypothetical protein JRN52_08270 [Nitrososphaerota archaeon]|nr:hypothetical protein [Nitrososphaerota archaeon]
MASHPPDKTPTNIAPIDPKFLRQRLSLLAWSRVGFGILAGLLAGFLGFLTVDFVPGSAQPNPNAYYGIYIAVLVYVLSYYFAKYWLVKGIPPKDKNRLVTQGIGSYIMMFIFVWILYNTSCYLHSCIHI